ncbi:Maf family protein [Deinococcus sp.]|uniref:Maf family protein n=1 Tax=Deinococcus sp. TaxID=47478 RepID=UPI003C7D8BB9
MGAALPPPELVLASGSPRRRELLGHLGVPFRVLASDLPEVSAHTAPAEVARDLAEQKARAVRALLGEAPALILAADTLVALEGRLLGKPRDAAQNAEYLRLLSGQTHTVYSGVALIGPDGLNSGVEATRVAFRGLSEAEMQHYAASGEGLDKAGGYGVQGLGMALVARIEGDYSGVVGFPLSLVIRLLRGAGVPVWGQA